MKKDDESWNAYEKRCHEEALTFMVAVVAGIAFVILLAWGISIII